MGQATLVLPALKDAMQAGRCGIELREGVRAEALGQQDRSWRS